MSPQRLARRSQIVLLWLDGLKPAAIAERLEVSIPTVNLWISRYGRGGVESLRRDAPGRGRRATIEAGEMMARLARAKLLDATGRPVSLRRAAAFLKVSPAAVWRALRKTDG